MPLKSNRCRWHIPTHLPSHMPVFLAALLRIVDSIHPSAAWSCWACPLGCPTSFADTFASPSNVRHPCLTNPLHWRTPKTHGYCKTRPPTRGLAVVRLCEVKIIIARMAAREHCKPRGFKRSGQVIEDLRDQGRYKRSLRTGFILKTADQLEQRGAICNGLLVENGLEKRRPPV